MFDKLQQSDGIFPSGMAYDLQARFDKLRAATSGSTLTSPTDLSFIRDNEDTATIKNAEDQTADEIGPIELSGKHSLSIIAADTGASSFASGGNDKNNHAATSPIDVPATSSYGETQSLHDDALQRSHYHEKSPLENYFQNRRPSITFNPEVTLESGQRRPLDEPLSKLVIDTRSRSRSILQELSRHTTRSSLARTYSDTLKTEFNPFTNERARTESQLNYPPLKTRPPENRSRYPTLQTAAYSPTAERPADLDQSVSLTSASTASSIRSEISTPTDTKMDCLVSPMSSFSPFHHPTSLEESATWPILPQQESVPRSKSYSFNRKGSMRYAQRQSSRRSTASSMSPATAFLSRFAREELSVEPDAEGQEVGEYVLGRQVGFGGFSTVKEAFTIEGQKRICRAVKIVRRHLANKDDIENERFQAEFEHEIGLWRCLSHRYILPLLAVHVTNFATFCFTNLVSGGNLFDLVRVNRKGLSGGLAQRYAYQLASAIRYLHEDMRVVHRDVKLENCLIDLSNPDVLTGGGNLLLCDFGLAEFVMCESNRSSPDPYQRRRKASPSRNFGSSEASLSIVGSLQYASPELLSSPVRLLDRSVDIWAFGVVIYALLVGDLPFQHPLQPRVQMMILAGEWDVEALIQAHGIKGMNEEVLELVHGCLQMQSSARWAISQVLNSRWLNGCQVAFEEMSESWKL